MKRLGVIFTVIFVLCSSLFAEPFDFVGKYQEGIYEVSYYESYKEGYFITFEDTSDAEDFWYLLQLTFPYKSPTRYIDRNSATIELQHFLENHEIVFLRTSRAFTVMGFYDENIIAEIDYYFRGE